MEGNDAFRSAAAAAAAADSPSAPAPARVPVVASQALHSKRHMLYRDYAARRTAAAAATTTTGARGRLSAAYRAVGEGVGAFLLLSLCLAMSVYLVVGRTSYTATDAGDGSDVSYVLLIDAGSSGSRLHIYECAPAEVKPLSLQHLPSHRTTSNVGLASFADASTESDAVSSLLPLLQTAVSVIPRASHGRTLVRVWATAGFRTLSTEQQHNLFAKLRNQISLFPFQLDSRSFNVISGQMEAVYAFATLNYLLFSSSSSSQSGETPTSTGALLEMGGASVQLCYEISESEFRSLPPSQRFELDFRSSPLWPTPLRRHIFLFAYSWLSFGSISARRRYEHELVNTVSTADVSQAPRDPCLLLGSTRFTSDGGVPLSAGGDFYECVASIERLHISNSSCRAASALKQRLRLPPADAATRSSLSSGCGMNGVVLPRALSASLSVYGTRAFYFSTNDFVGKAGVYESASTALSWSRFCSLPEKEVMALHASSPVLSELPLHCFQCAWMYVLLGPMGLNIMRLSADVSVITLLQLDGISLSWQLGSALLNERQHHHHHQQPSYSTKSAISSPYAVALFSLVALSLMLLIYWNKFRRPLGRRRTYAHIRQFPTP